VLRVPPLNERKREAGGLAVGRQLHESKSTERSAKWSHRSRSQCQHRLFGASEF
jgi:hypothetical protein